MTKQYQTLFLTDRSSHHQEAAQRVAPAQLDLTFMRRPTRAALLERLADVEILISERADVIDAALLDAAPKLQLIQRLGSLTYDIDVAAAHQRGISVCAWPIKGCIMVAEHMLMQMLALVKRLPEVQAIAEAAGDWDRPARRTDENTFAYNWSRREGIDGIYEQRVGILGFGEIGAELARRLQPFAPAQVLYHKRQRLPESIERELGLTYTDPQMLIAQVDFLCVLLPYSPATDQMLNAQTFTAMKPGSFVVSCGSGSVIDEAALAVALQSGHLAGAALDTFAWEPLQRDNPLLPLTGAAAINLLLTPHTAAGAPSRKAESGRNSDFHNIINFLAGDPLLHLVNP